MIDLPPAKLQSSAVANAVIEELRAQGMDAFKKGGYYDVSPRVHDVVLRQARIALEAHGEACARAAREQERAAILADSGDFVPMAKRVAMELASEVVNTLVPVPADGGVHWDYERSTTDHYHFYSDDFSFTVDAPETPENDRDASLIVAVLNRMRARKP
jgi:hypothetical protein